MRWVFDESRQKSQRSEENMKRAKSNQALTADGDKKQQEKQSSREDKNQRLKTVFENRSSELKNK